MAGTRSLQDVGFDVAVGEVVAIVGGSGASKTTLLETVLGLRVPTAGVVEVDEAEGDLDLAVALHTRALVASERHLPTALLTNTYRCLAASSLRRAGRCSQSAELFLESIDFLRRRATLPGWHRHAPWVLESVGGWLIDVGRVANGVEVIGTARGLRTRLGAPVPYWDERRTRPDIDRARSTPGEGGVASALGTGLLRSLDETVDLVAVELRAGRTTPAKP